MLMVLHVANIGQDQIESDATSTEEQIVGSSLHFLRYDGFYLFIVSERNKFARVEFRNIWKYGHIQHCVDNLCVENVILVGLEQTDLVDTKKHWTRTISKNTWRNEDLRMTYLYIGKSTTWKKSQFFC